MNNEFSFGIKRICFDENYHPSENTRITTNFANLARGVGRQENLRKTLTMINNRFNDLAEWDNPEGDRYQLEIDIVSVDMDIDGNGQPFPIIEMLQTHIVDKKNHRRIEGIVGNNFSSYVRDYDFSVVLPEHNKNRKDFSLPEGFGVLHGNLFKTFVKSKVYEQNFSKPPVICLSVASSKTYYRTANTHPVLGVEYKQNERSSTDLYFERMGLKVRYFMPKNSSAPFAFYFSGDLLNDYSNLELIGTISMMESFQKIYRPEIYNANSVAGHCYQPRLSNHDYSSTQIVYDREERSQLAIEQGKLTEEKLIKPYKQVLESWVASCAN